MTDTSTLRRLSPITVRTHGSSISMGTNDGRNGVTLCPTALAIAYPSPVEPVSG